MSTKKTKSAPAEVMIPLQFKTRSALREKLLRIATVNGLSMNDVAGMCLAAGLPIVEVKMREIHEPELPQAA